MDLSYFNSRVRAMMGRLLRESDYGALFNLKDEAQFLERLKATAYGPFVNVAGARFDTPGEVVSSALTQSLADAFERLWKNAPDPARALLEALVSTWEAYNLKAVIRGLARGVGREDVRRAFVPAGRLDRAALDTLLAARGVEDLLKILDTWSNPYATPVREGMDEFLRNGSINAIEINIDLFSYKAALKALKGRSGSAKIIRDILVLMIDIRNVVTLVNIAGQEYTDEGASGLFIDGGRALSGKAFLELSAVKERGVLLSRLAEAVSDPLLAEVIASTGPGTIGVLEERLATRAEKRLRTLSVVEPLSIALPASFIFMKVREVKNLRLIDRAVAFGIPEEEIREMLIYPR